MTTFIPAEYRTEKTATPVISVWNIETGDLFLQLEGHTGKGRHPIIFTPDSKYAVSAMYIQDKEGCTLIYTHQFIVWNLETGKALYPAVTAQQGLCLQQLSSMPEKDWKMMKSYPL